MKQITFILGAFLLIIIHTRCRKKDAPTPPGAYSWWSVNNNTIAYKNIVVTQAPLLTELRVNTPPISDNELTIAFRMGSLPHSGAYKIDYTASDAATMCNVYVTYKGNTYDVIPVYNTTMLRVSTLSNGKGHYEIEPTWFYKQFDPSDSILVEGAITEP